MVRVVIYLALVALLALGAVWLAERPGEVAITWLGWRTETSVMVAATVVAIVVAIAMMVWSLVRFVLRSPGLISMVLSQRRGVRGYLALSRGLIAVGAGDARAARKAAEEAERIAPGEPLALLLNAQCAQLSGDRAGAELAFRAMAERADTKLLGLRGLYIEAQRRKDATAAQRFAEEAAKAAPSLAWAGQATLEYRCAAGDWAGALSALDRNHRHGLIDRTQYKRQRAVLITARALAAEDDDRGRARALALDAVKLAPTLVPAVDLAARLLGESGDLRRASRMIEKAWQANPHPDLAEAYAHLRPGDSARERLARVQSLALKAPGHIESALAVARAAVDAQEFAAARAALKSLVREPTQRVAALMAEIEERESGDEGRAREWMARALRAPRDPKWTADGIVSDRWMPVSPASGRLDAFEWKVPVAEIADEREAIEGEEPHAEQSAEPAPRAEQPPKSIPPPQPEAPAAHRNAVLPASRAAPQVTPARAEPVVPLVHAPDDPGPDASPSQDPAPKAVSKPRLLRLFK